MEDIEDPSGKGCIAILGMVGIVLTGFTYYELGWSGIKMIAPFAPIIPLIYWVSERWGRVDK